MIGRLNGVVVDVDQAMILVEVAGVGYEVEVPASTAQSIEIGNPVILFTHLLTRDDAQLLFGFNDVQQRRLFRTLIRISGVGPKLAMALLSTLGVSGLVHCVREDDKARLTRVPGVGKKTAERLLVELRDRLKEWDSPEPAVSAPARSGHLGRFEEAELALLALGYKPQEAARALARVERGEELPVSELIRRALKVIM